MRENTDQKYLRIRNLLRSVSFTFSIKWILVNNEIPFPLKPSKRRKYCDDFEGYRSYLIYLNSFSIIKGMEKLIKSLNLTQYYRQNLATIRKTYMLRISISYEWKPETMASRYWLPSQINLTTQKLQRGRIVGRSVNILPISTY